MYNVHSIYENTYFCYCTEVRKNSSSLISVYLYIFSSCKRVLVPKKLKDFMSIKNRDVTINLLKRNSIFLCQTTHATNKNK